MRAKIRQLFCLIVIVIIVLAIGAAAINVYMVWGTKGRILKKRKKSGTADEHF